MEVGLLGAFACQFGDARYGLALLFALLYFLLDDVCDVGVLVEIVVHLFLDEVAHELVHAHSREGEGVAVGVLVGGHGERAELDFGLALEEGLDDADGHGGHEAVAHVLHVVVLAEVFLDGAGYVFLECALVGVVA